MPRYRIGLVACAALIAAGVAVSSRSAYGTVEDEASGQRALPLKEFLALAAQRDTAFQAILVDALGLRYQKDLRLPARDLVASATEQMDFFLDQDREDPDTLVGLSKAFPMTGTDIEASYEVSPRSTSTHSASSMSFTLTQSIAENAFGRGTRLLDRIVGLEVDIARYQIFEAYEDYFGALILAYLDWYEAYENLRIGESSVEQNQKLLDNINERQKNKIALPIDVNKITLQVFAKRETLIELKQRYQSALDTVEAAMRYDGDAVLVPEDPERLPVPQGLFDFEYDRYRSEGRTEKVLDLLEKKSGLEVAKEADDLLPSIDLMVGYERTGTEYRLESGDGEFFLGLSAEWPFPDQVDRAEHRLAEISRDKTEFEVDDTRHKLRTRIKTLYHEILREEELAAIADEKIRLAGDVLKDETENYTYGKVTLNDYINAVNVLDSNRFNRVRHQMLLQKLLVDWQRLTDQLVGEREVESGNPRFF